jgi:tRNA (guanine37-N1)-methyltransferase
MRIDFVTLFPEMIEQALSHSIMARAVAQDKVSFRTSNPRDFTTDVHKTVDDSPFGGGPGMVMKPDLVGKAIDCLIEGREPKIILTEPWGKKFTQADAKDLSGHEQVIFLCGHYEGIDGRVAEKYGAEIFSLGDFVLTGGELPCLMMCDAIVRILPGVLGNEGSLEADSHSEGLLTGPNYTRPWDWDGLTPPEILRSGDHAKMAKWRRQRSLRMTRELRPDLFALAPLEKGDIDLL